MFMKNIKVMRSGALLKSKNKMNEIILIALITLMGAMFVKLVSRDTHVIQNWAIGFLIGLGVTTFVSFGLSWIGLRINYINILFVVIFGLFLISIVNIFIRTNFIDLFKIRNIFDTKATSFENLILILLILFFTISFILSTYFPINVWDALALYDFRAKVIAGTGYFVQIANNFNYFSHYPLYTSLTHTFVYLSGGQNPQYLYSIYLMSFAVVYYFFARKNVSKVVALVSTLLLVTIPEIFEHSTIAYTNLPYTIFYVCGIFYLNYSILEKRNDYLFLSSILIGLSTWVRSDLPFWLSGAFLVILFSIKLKRMLPVIIYFPVFLLIQQTWNLFASNLFGADYSTSGQLISAGGSIISKINFYRFYEVLTYLYTNVFVSWGIVSVLFVMALIWNFWNRKIIAYPLLIIILLNILGLIAGTYVFSFKVAEWKDIADSATRMAMFFPPLMLYYVTLSFGRSFRKDI